MSERDATVSHVAASVIIPVHNAEDSVGEQLGALAAQEGAVSFEVVVVLNRCTDDSAAVVESFRDKLDLHLIIADEQPSAAYARNVGARYSTAPVLLFCDADDRVGTHWVSALHESLQTADFVGGRLVIDLENVPRWRHPTTGANPINGGLHSVDVRVLYPITASFGCRRAPFLAVGGFDESFAAASEDIDLALSLYRAGYVMTFADDAELLYRPRRTLRQMLQQSRTYAQGHAQLAAKEGRLIPVGRLRGAAQVTVAVVTKSIRKRTADPRVLVLAVAEAHYRLDALRRVAAIDDVGPQEANPVVDYVVSVRNPVTKWFALSDRRDRARRYFREQPDADVLDVVASLLHEGDTMIDLEPNGGAVAIAAAFTVGASGSVWSCEPSGPRLQLLQQNAARHGCQEIIRVVDQLDVANPPIGVTLVRFDQDLRVLGSADNYRRLIDETPEAMYIVPGAVVGDGARGKVTDEFISSRWRLTRLPPPDGSTDTNLQVMDRTGQWQSNSQCYFLAERAK